MRQRSTTYIQNFVLNFWRPWLFRAPPCVTFWARLDCLSFPGLGIGRCLCSLSNCCPICCNIRPNKMVNAALISKQEISLIDSFQITSTYKDVSFIELFDISVLCTGDVLDFRSISWLYVHSLTNNLISWLLRMLSGNVNWKQPCLGDFSMEILEQNSSIKYKWSMLTFRLSKKDIATWTLNGWWLCCQPSKSSVSNFLQWPLLLRKLTRDLLNAHWFSMGV